MTSHVIRHSRGSYLAAVLLLAGGGTARAQDTSEMREVLSRLERLEKDNRALAAEVQALRQEVAGLRAPGPGGAALAKASPEATGTDGSSSATQPEQAPASTPQAAPEAEAVDHARIAELAQTKVEASQRFPIRITGMALFNAYVNGQHNNDTDNPTVASLLTGEATGGGTIRQTTLGFLFDGPQIFAGGRVSGSLYMDFFGGSTLSIGHLMRVRTAAINLDWTNTSIMAGQDKPLISPRDPDSLAQVGFSPLTSAGNPWLWQPQLRIEQRFSLGNDSGLRAQAGVFQTSIPSAAGQLSGPYDVEESRPGVEGRLELWHRWGETGRLEVAGGIHYNRNHLGPFSLPSDVYSMDWFFRPIRKLEFSGMFFHGRNVTVLGALRPGFTILPDGQAIPVRSNGGWGQMKIPITERLAFNIYGGEQVNRGVDLGFGDAASNQAIFSNLMYRLAPNVIISLEGGQVRTAYYRIGNRLNDHYDVAIAYLF